MGSGAVRNGSQHSIRPNQRSRPGYRVLPGFARFKIHPSYRALLIPRHESLLPPRVSGRAVAQAAKWYEPAALADREGSRTLGGRHTKSCTRDEWMSNRGLAAPPRVCNPARRKCAIQIEVDSQTKSPPLPSSRQVTNPPPALTLSGFGVLEGPSYTAYHLKQVG